MSHRRAAKDAKKAAAAEAGRIVIDNVSTQMRGIGHGVSSFRETHPKTVKKWNKNRGAGWTRPHPIGTKEARRKANKRARASRKGA